MELCIGVAVLGIMGGLTAFAFTTVISRYQRIKEDIQMLFLARSAIERWKASGGGRLCKENVTSQHGYQLSLHKEVSHIPGYEELTLRINSRSGNTITITTARYHEDV